MSKELEVLEKLANEYPREDYKLGSQYDIEFACIEQALIRKDKLETAIKELFSNHIELVKLDNCCYFKIKNSKGSERSYTSKTFEDFWKEVFR